jgi:hypothetical protein
MSAKALSLAAELRDDLARRFTLVSNVLFDTDGQPYIQVSQGTMVAGQQAAVVKIAQIAPLGTDAIGLTARNYGHPLRIQAVVETSTIANVPLMTGANLLTLLADLALRGVRMELYMSANANAVGPEDILPANLRTTFDPDLKYRTMSGQ